MLEIDGLIGLVALVIAVWAIVKIIDSPLGTAPKVVWIVLVLVLPFLGVILWLLFGRKR